MAGLENKLGCYGKLPAFGDFVTRGLSHAVTEKWDAWLQAGLAHSRNVFEAGWLEAYQKAPLWRFCLQSGVLGEMAWCGLMFPSVDRVGRHFPFAIFMSLPPQTELASVCLEQNDWFDQLESIALQCRDPEFQFDAWFDALDHISPPEGLSLVDLENMTVPLKAPEMDEGGLRLVMINGSDDTALVERYLYSPGQPYSVWWRREDEKNMVAIQIARDLPLIERFPALLDEQWLTWDWREKIVVWRPE